MTSFRKKLLAGVAATALLLGIYSSQLPDNKQKTPTRPLKSAFNAASNDLQLVGDDADIEKLNEIINLSAKSQTARTLFSHNPLRGWTLSLDDLEEDGLFVTAGFVSPSERKIVLNRNLSKNDNTSTLVHEVAHIDQERLGIGTSIYTHEGNIRILKIQEACSAALQTRAMWEIGREIPEAWQQYMKQKSWAAKIWQQSIDDDTQRERSGIRTSLTFQAFFNNDVSTKYERNEAEHQIKKRDILKKISKTFDPDKLFSHELPVEATIASLTLHGINLPPSKGFDLSTPFYAGCHEQTVKMLEKAGVSGKNLPKVRPDAPSLPDQSAIMDAMALMALIMLGYATYQGIQALMPGSNAGKRKQIHPAPRPK